MLISVLSAIYFLGLARGKKMTEIMKSLSHSVVSIAMIMLLISGAGSLKQVLVDGGVSNYIGGLTESVRPFTLIPGMAYCCCTAYMHRFSNCIRSYCCRYCIAAGYRNRRKP